MFFCAANTNSFIPVLSSVRQQYTASENNRITKDTHN